VPPWRVAGQLYFLLLSVVSSLISSVQTTLHTVVMFDAVTPNKLRIYDTEMRQIIFLCVFLSAEKQRKNV
jgi:hypothetical protein